MLPTGGDPVNSAGCRDVGLRWGEAVNVNQPSGSGLVPPSLTVVCLFSRANWILHSTVADAVLNSAHVWKYFR